MTEYRKSIFFCGDPHGVFDHIVDAVLEHRPAAIILLGDMDCMRPLDVELAEIIGKTEVYYIHGNHDTDSEDNFNNLVKSRFENIHGRVVEIAGFKVGGLGGVFRTRAWDPNLDPDWHPKRTPAAYMRTLGKGNLWNGGLPLRHRSTIFPSEMYSLSRQRADVLVTHEAPGAHEFGVEALSRLAVEMRVTRAFHGHHHKDIAYTDGIWRGVGLQGVTALDGTIIVPGAFTI